MNIFLIGFMGCGKSYWAKKLSTVLHLASLDLDNVIEDIECTSIYDVFYAKGEDYFRKIENIVLQDIINGIEKYIISTGGGTPCFYNNLQLMNNNGITIYLKASVDYLFERLQSQQKSRPLIATFNHIELKKFIKDTIALREPFYQLATSIIDIETTTLPIFVQTIQQCTNQH